MVKSIGTILVVAVGLMYDTSVNDSASSKISERQTVETVQNIKGTVRYIPEADVYMLYCPAKHLKFNVQNLPNKFRHPGMQLVFSGNIKATQPMEDGWGEYFELTAAE